MLFSRCSILWKIGLIGIFISANAQTTYFVSPSGNDLNTGKTTSQAWKSISQVNTIKSSLLPGDFVLFERGGVYYGELNIASSGTKLNPIYIGAYGNGKKPVLSGSEVTSNWISLGGNLWEYTYTSSKDLIKNLVIDGKSYPLARYPDYNSSNGGFLPISSCIADTVIVNTGLGSDTNYTNAEAVIRTNRWIIDRLKIKSHNGDTLVTSTKTTYVMEAGFGFFIQNHPTSLNLENEWVYQYPEKKILLYASTYNPNTKTIELSSNDYVLRADNCSYLTFQDIHISNGAKANVYLTNCSNVSFINNEVSNAGTEGVYFYNTPYTRFLNNDIHDINNTAVQIVGNYSEVKYNRIYRIAVLQGIGNSRNGTYNGLTVTSKAGIVQYNIIDSVGYIGISYGKDSIRIVNNVIKNVCLAKDDGGAIYSWNNSNQTVFNKIWIENNIVINPKGNGFGTKNPLSSAAEGIYCDDAMNNTLIKNNTIIGSTDYGLYLHNNYNMTVENNLMYGNKTQVCIKHDALSANNPIRNVIFKNNTLVNTKETQRLLHLQTIRNDLDSFGLFDSNYYIAPYNTSLETPFYTQHVPGYPSVTTTKSTYYYPQEWLQLGSKDLHSSLSPIYYQRYSINQLLSSNKIRNSQFINDIANWTCWGSNGCTKNWIPNGIDTGTVALTFPAGSTSTYVELNSAIDTLVKDKYYVLRFMAKASKPNTKIEIRFLKNASNYALNALLNKVPISQNTANYEYIFKATLTEVNSRITFRLYPQDSLLWIDNIELYEADIVFNNIEDSLLCTTNEDSLQKFHALTHYYMNKEGVLKFQSDTIIGFSSSFLLRNTSFNGYNALIILKNTYGDKIDDATVTLGTQTKHSNSNGEASFTNVYGTPLVMTVEKEGFINFQQDFWIVSDTILRIDLLQEPVTKHTSVASTDVKLYPNPVKEGGLINYQLNTALNKYCIIYNSLGIPVKKQIIVENTGVLDIRELPKGLYLLEFSGIGDKALYKIVITNYTD